MSIDFLFSDHRKRILGLLLLRPEMRYHIREIARLTNATSGSVHRELIKLANAGVLIREVSGQQVYFRANVEFTIFNELASILRKTSGLADVLKNSLAPIVEKIEAAFIYGSVARGTENAGSDIDILIIGEVSFTEVVQVSYSAQSILGREINPKVYQRKQWEKLANEKDPFIQEIIKNPKIIIIGTENDIA